MGGGLVRLMQLQQRLNPQLLLLTNFFGSNIDLLKGILTFNYEQYWILVCFDFHLLPSIWPSKSQGWLDLLIQTCTTSKYEVQRLFPAYHANKLIIVCTYISLKLFNVYIFYYLFLVTWFLYNITICTFRSLVLLSFVNSLPIL